MVIYLRHEKHGTKVACTEAEAKADEAKGWKRYQLAALVQPPVQSSAVVNEPSARNALIAQYVEKFGKKPHHKKSEATLKAELHGNG